MILSAHQSAYLPWLGYFHKLAVADRFVSYDHVESSAYSFENRNRIKLQGRRVWLTVPVRRHARARIVDLEIDGATWRHKHWETIRHAYGKTRYFSRYADRLREVYGRDWRRLVDLNRRLREILAEILGITTPVDSSVDLHIRQPKAGGVLELCRSMGASAFVFGERGRDYADPRRFERAGVRPLFRDYVHPTYPQQDEPFICNLSVLDLVFNCGPQSLDILMRDNLRP